MSDDRMKELFIEVMQDMEKCQQLNDAVAAAAGFATPVDSNKVMQSLMMIYLRDLAPSKIKIVE